VTKKNDYAVVGTNTITFDAALAPTNAASSFATPISFSVKVSDPCETTNINQVAFNSMTVGNGLVVTQNFVEATDSVEVANQGLNLCGTRSYMIVDNNDGTDVAVSWIALTGDRLTGFTITASPTDDALVNGGS
jgi:hypothetical protein